MTPQHIACSLHAGSTLAGNSAVVDGMVFLGSFSGHVHFTQRKNAVPAIGNSGN
jgi:hypothetical protein